MHRSQKFANPFYGLLLGAGLLFVMTAVSYGVMAFREARPLVVEAEPRAVDRRHPLMAWMSEHGEHALLAELGFLAVFTFAAIGTDGYWQRRAATRGSQR